MPETIRTANERLRSRPWRGGFLAAFVTANFILSGSAAGAEGHSGTAAVDAIHRTMAILRGQGISLLAFILSLLGLGLFASVILLRAPRSEDRIERRGRDGVVGLEGETDRVKTLLLCEPQILVTWAAASEQPDITGEPSIVVSGAAPERVLAFDTWLEPAAAQRLQQA